jgi:hypothetical protein
VKRTIIPTAVTGSRGLCNEAKEAARNAVPSPTDPRLECGVGYETIEVMERRSYGGFFEGKNAHMIYQLVVFQMQSILLELAKGAS